MTAMRFLFLPRPGIVLLLMVFLSIPELKATDPCIALEKAERLLAQGDSLREVRKYPQAERLLQEAADIYLAEEKYEEYVKALQQLSHVYYDSHRLNERIKLLYKVVEACKSYLPSNHRSAGKANCYLGRALIGAYRIEEAESYLSKALQIGKERKDPEIITEPYFFLIQCYFYKNDLPLVKSGLDSLEFFLSNAKEKKSHMVSFLDLKSHYYSQIGDHDKANETAHLMAASALQLSQRTARDSVNLALAYTKIGQGQFQKGDFGEATSYYKKAISIHRSLTQPPQANLASALSNLGYSVYRTNKYKEALRYCLEAKRYFENPGNPFVARNQFINLTHIFTILSAIEPYDADLLEEYALKTLNMAIKRNYEVETPYYQLGVHHFTTREYRKAIQHLKQSVASVLESELGDSPLLPQTRYRLAASYFEVAEYDSALIELQKSLAGFCPTVSAFDLRSNPATTQNITDQMLSDVLRLKGHSLYELSKSDEKYLKLAFDTYTATVPLLDFFRKGYKNINSKWANSQQAHPIYVGIVQTGLDLFRKTGDFPYAREAFLAAEKAKALLLYDSQQGAAALGYASIPPSLLRQEENLKRDLAFYQGKILEEEAQEIYKDTLRLSTYQGKVFDLKQELKTWEEGIKKDYPQYLQDKYSSIAISPQEVIDSLLQENEALIEFSEDRGDFFTFFISREGMDIHKTKLPEDFQALLRKFSRSLSDYTFIHDSVAQCHAQFTESARSLYQLLLEKPLQDHPDIKKLLIIPEGPLSQIPFEVLLTEAPQRESIDYTRLPYLLRKYQVRYAPSAFSLLQNRRFPKTKGQKGCLAFAPGYSGKASTPTRGQLSMLRDGETPLAGAQREVKALSQLQIPGRFLFGNNATEASFKTLAPQYRILHLALHGQSDPEEPLNSRIIFSSTPKDTCEDNSFYAYELKALPLQADLAVLSACESGIGQYRRGVGIMSLGRDFLAAGVRSVVMTLWKVEDRSSAALMEHFYSELQQGKTTAAALHSAKIAQLDKADSRTAHPFYWAAYVNSGTSEALDLTEGTSNPWMLTGLGLGSLLLLGMVRFRQKRKLTA